MSAEGIVTDPALLSVLQAADRAREQSLAIVELIEQYHAAPTSRENELDQTQRRLALSREHKNLNAHLAQLRGLNRKAVLEVRRTKQETSEARQEIDSLHLQLQNLLYEQRHLEGDIIACEQYKHRYPQLSMISQDEFIAAHPEHADKSDHDLTIARIEDERVARQTLEDERQTLQKRKEALSKVTQAKKEELAKFDADVEKWLAGEANIRKVFDARQAAADA